MVDDAQWLDRASAQVLEFVARRLGAEPMAMVFAVRETDEEPVLAGLPELVVRGLRQRRCGGTARVGGALAARSPGAGPRPGRVPRQSAGAPGAAAGTDGDGAGLRGQRGERLRRRWSTASSRDSCASCGSSRRRPRQLLLAAAAEPVGDVTVLWRRGRAAGHRDRRGHRGRGRRVDRAGRPGPVPASARPLGRLPVGDTGGTAGGPPRPRRRHRPGHRSGPPCLAPRPGGGGHGRGGRGRARTRR